MDFYPIPTCCRFCFLHIGFLSPLRNLGSVRISGLNIYIYISSKSSAQQAQPRAIAPETRPFLKRKGSSRSPKHHFSRGFCCWFQELVSAKITQILHGISGTSTVRIMRCHEWKWNYSCSDLLTMFGTTGSYMFFCYLKWSINHIERMNNHQQKNMPPVWAFTISIRDSYSFII